jgi:rhodanese-related sulfurtransferase
VVVAEPGREREAIMRLGRIGFDNVAGYLEGGLQALASRSDLLGRTERATAAVMAEELDASEPSVVVDVRTAREWQDKHIAGSVNVPLHQLLARVGELPRDGRLFVHCAGGYRSSIAISLLQLRGFDRLVELVGGLAAWEAARLPHERRDAALVAQGSGRVGPESSERKNA